MTAPLLPPVLPRWPSTLRAASLGAGPSSARGDAGARASARIRAETLFWPATRARAARPRALALDSAGLAAARAAWPDEEIVFATELAAVDPDRLEAIFGASPALVLWARLGGIATPDRREIAEPAALLAAARGVSPWTGEALDLEEAVEAQALLRRAAMRGRGPARLVGMSRWKRGCLAPFLTGPDGPPRPAPSVAAAQAAGGPVVLWGAGDVEADLRVEDGFLRSVGLGLLHTPPLSLAIASGPPHFDATGPNAFDRTVAEAEFSPALRARAARLRAEIVALGLTKYNLPGRATPLPDPGGRPAVLAPGQVASDASIRLGATRVRSDAELLAATRARFPDAFIIYKPHPDTLTGLREGALDPAEARRAADAVVTDVPMEDCLAWCGRVATITSLAGFEALLRGKAVTCFGRPFFAGWGLSDDVDPPPRARRLDLDALVAAALILHPSYVDPVTRLPAPPEIVLRRLARMRADAGRPAARLERLWRAAAARLLSAF